MLDNRLKNAYLPGYCVSRIEVAKVRTALRNSVPVILKIASWIELQVNLRFTLSFFLCPTARAMTDFQKYH